MISGGVTQTILTKVCFENVGSSLPFKLSKIKEKYLPPAFVDTDLQRLDEDSIEEMRKTLLELEGIAMSADHEGDEQCLIVLSLLWFAFSSKLAMDVEDSSATSSPIDHPMGLKFLSDLAEKLNTARMRSSSIAKGTN